MPMALTLAFALVSKEVEVGVWLNHEQESAHGEGVRDKDDDERVLKEKLECSRMQEGTRIQKHVVQG